MTRLLTRRCLLATGLVVAGLVYCWLVAGLRPFTAPIYAAVAVPTVVMAAVAWRHSGRTRLAQPVSLWQTWPWLVLVGLLAAVELQAYASSPRSDHPTLSSIADAMMGSHPGRAAMIAIWLALGWALFAARGWGRMA